MKRLNTTTNEKNTPKKGKNAFSVNDSTTAVKKAADKKHKHNPRFKTVAVILLLSLITVCICTSLFTVYMLYRRYQNNPEHSAGKPSPHILSVSGLDTQNGDGSYTVTITAVDSENKTDELLCYFGAKSQPELIEDSEWLNMTDGVYTYNVFDTGSYYIFVSDRYGNIADVGKTEIVINAIKSITINPADPYMNIGMVQNLTAELDMAGENDSTIVWNSSNEDAVTVKDGRVTALAVGKAVITATASNGLTDELEITVTDLLRAPRLSSEKPLYSAGIYTEEQAKLIDTVLESRVITAGYGTRAGVVAAARFIPLEFKYKIPYFYENGRLDANPDRPVCDGEGRFYHKGLYLTHSKFEVLDKTKIRFGPATWGEPLTNWEDIGHLVPGAKYANGMSCSGFISWCFLNGGVPLGDVGAGDTPEYDWELCDYGERIELTEELMRSDRVKVGDMIGCDGHIALIVGLDDENVYVAESLGNGIVIAVHGRYDDVLTCGDYSYVMLLDEVYAKHNGTGDLTDMWTDYPENEDNK